MKHDGLTVADGPPDARLVTVTTDNDWMANKWGMSKQAVSNGLRETLLDQFAKIGALNLMVLVVLAVLTVAGLLWFDRR